MEPFSFKHAVLLMRYPYDYIDHKKPWPNPEAAQEPSIPGHISESDKRSATLLRNIVLRFVFSRYGRVVVWLPLLLGVIALGANGVFAGLVGAIVGLAILYGTARLFWNVLRPDRTYFEAQSNL